MMLSFPELLERAAPSTSATRAGTAWYSDLTCLAVDASIPVEPVPGTSAIQPANSIKRY